MLVREKKKKKGCNYAADTGFLLLQFEQGNSVAVISNGTLEELKTCPYVVSLVLVIFKVTAQ